MAVVLGHAVRVDTLAGHALGSFLQMRPDVHASAVEPDEERLARRVGTVHEVERAVEDFLVDRLHPLLRQGAGVLDPAVSGA